MDDLDNKYSDFIATLSHELRTPLTSIRGFADTLISSKNQLSEEQQLKFLQIIKNQSERLIKMVEDIFEVSKLDTECPLLIFKPTDITNIMEQTIQMIKTQYPKHKFKIVCPDKIPQIYVDTDKFQQIIVNLVENAAKYSLPGSLVTTKLAEKGSFLSIQVIDEGIGISQCDIDKIFKKFSRLDTPLTRKTQGSGIGLYITKCLTEKMNGKISVSSSEKGSVFEIVMPVFAPETQMQKKMEENQKC